MKNFKSLWVSIKQSKGWPLFNKVLKICGVVFAVLLVLVAFLVLFGVFDSLFVGTSEIVCGTLLTSGVSGYGHNTEFHIVGDDGAATRKFVPIDNSSGKESLVRYLQTPFQGEQFCLATKYYRGTYLYFVAKERVLVQDALSAYVAAAEAERAKR